MNPLYEDSQFQGPKGAAGIRRWPGAPSNGTANVETITINGNPDGGTFRLSYQGPTIPAQPYNVSLALLQAALCALPGIGAGGVVVTGTPGSSYVLTWQAPKACARIVLANNSLTKAGVPVADPTIVNSTPGVDPVPVGVPALGLVVDTSGWAIYQNIGTSDVPNFSKIGNIAAGTAT